MRRTWFDSSGFSFVLGHLTPGTQEAGHLETPMMVNNKNLNKSLLSLANEPGRVNSARLNFYNTCSVPAAHHKKLALSTPAKAR